MTPQIRLQKQHLANLQCVREIGQTDLRRVVEEVKKLSVAPLQPRELEAIIGKALGKNETFAAAVVRQLLSLHGMVRQLDLSTEEIFAGLSSGLRGSGLDEDAMKKWDSVSDTFQDLFELPIVRLTAKALDLSYQHSHLLQRSQIITDIRPLYNRDATEIQGTVISHKFLLRYDDIEGEHALSLAVDQKDIESLIKQCQRALKKSQTAEAQLSDRAGLKTIVPGKD